MSYRSDTAPPVERIGRYALLVEIASGGMGRVFLGRASGDAGFDRLVAVKRIHPHLAREPEVYAMVSDEARIGSLVRHPNVVGVIDVVDHGDEVLLILDYVEGASLADLVQSAGELPLPVLARIVIDALRGLHAAHEATNLVGEPLDVVHRDVSPQNLLVGTDGTTRILDFGIATGLDRAASTRTGVVKGKLRYLSPEQIDGEAEVDRRADVFAMGCVIFERLAGGPPFEGSDESSRMARALLGNVDFSAIEAKAPEMIPVLQKALARRRTERHATALEMAAAIRAATAVAEPEEVATIVRRATDVRLVERRQKVEEALLHLADEEANAIEAEDLTGDIPPNAVEAPPNAPKKPGWIAAAGLALLAANVVGWSLLLSRDDSTKTTTTTATATPTPTATTTTIAVVAQTTVTAVAPSPSVIPIPASTGTTTRVLARPSASASATKPELHGSPYGTTGLDGGVR